MVAVLAPNLGLEPGRQPDLTDAATRKRLSPAAVEAFFKILESWELKNEEGMALLGGVSSGKYYELKKSQKGLLTQDELTRVSFVIGIFKALNILFSRKLASQWVSRPNSNPLFADSPPIRMMIQGGMPGILSVRRLLDARRGGAG
jgi:uncharacterized protein (DUF2384 family)